MDLFSMLVGTIPQGRLETMIEAEDVLNELNLDAHHYLINSVLGGSPEHAGLETGEAIEFCYYDTLFNAIKVFGIRLVDDNHSLKDILHILRGVVSITDPANHDVVESEVESGVSSEETLANILSQLEEPDMFWFLGKLDFVDADIIERIKGELNNVEFAMELDERHTQVLTKYREHVSKENAYLGVVYNNVDNVEFLPMTFRTMFVALQDQLRDLKADDLAEEVIQLMILSEEELDGFPEKLSKAFDAFHAGDPNWMSDYSRIVKEKGYDS